MPMTNIQMTREGDVLSIKIDLAQEHGFSKAGKTLTVAKTGGFIAVPGKDGEDEDSRLIINLNCNKKKA